ncbi:MAG: hypothetical protein ACM31C_02855 [Acidobacteriota bacterium]
MRGMALAVGLVLLPVVASAQPHDTDPAAPEASVDRESYRVDAGVALLSRALTFDTRSFLQAPPAMRSSTLGVRVAGEAYPFATRDSRPQVAGWGIAGEYESALGLQLYQANASGMPLPVDQHRWMLGARFRYAFGDASMPTMTLALDYADRVFAVDRSTGNVDMPDVDYAGFEPGVDVRVPVTHTISLLVGSRLTLLQSSGDISSPSQYGRANITGGRAMTGLDFVVGRHLAVRLEGDVAVLGMSFDGSGMQANNRDGDPTTIDVGSATDRYWGGSATMAIFY